VSLILVPRTTVGHVTNRPSRPVRLVNELMIVLCVIFAAASQYPVIVDDQGIYGTQPAYASQVSLRTTDT